MNHSLSQFSFRTLQPAQSRSRRTNTGFAYLVAAALVGAAGIRVGMQATQGHRLEAGAHPALDLGEQGAADAATLRSGVDVQVLEVRAVTAA